MMENLKPCPFCGGEAEIHRQKGNQFYRSFCKTIDDVNDYLEEHRRYGDVVNERVNEKYHKSTGYSGSRKSGYYFSVSAEYLLLVPRCADPNCLGRTTRTYRFEDEAIEAWNRRVNDD